MGISCSWGLLSVLRGQVLREREALIYTFTGPSVHVIHGGVSDNVTRSEAHMAQKLKTHQASFSASEWEVQVDECRRQWYTFNCRHGDSKASAFNLVRFVSGSTLLPDSDIRPIHHGSSA